MKLVMAIIINPFKLDEVREALTAIGVEGLTVTEGDCCKTHTSSNGMNDFYLDIRGLLQNAYEFKWYERFLS